MQPLRKGRTAYIAVWIIFLVLMAALGICVYLNRTGSMDDTILTICTSVLSITLTSVVVIFAVVFLKKDNITRYNEVNHSDKEEEGKQ